MFRLLQSFLLHFAFNSSLHGCFFDPGVLRGAAPYSDCVCQSLFSQAGPAGSAWLPSSSISSGLRKQLCSSLWETWTFRHASGRLKWSWECDWCIPINPDSSESAAETCPLQKNPACFMKLCFPNFPHGSDFIFWGCICCPLLVRELKSVLLPNLAHTLAAGCFIWLDSGTYTSLAIKPALGRLAEMQLKP